MSSLRNISEIDGEYKMSHSLFVIHVAFSSLILVTGVCVNTISVGVIVRLKLARETSVLFTLHLMIVNLAASIIAMSVSLINSFHSSGRKDMFCRITGFVVFVLIGVQMCNITLISISAYLKVSHSTLGKAFFARTRNVALCLGTIWIIPLFIMSMPATELWGEFSLSNHAPWCYPFTGGFGIFVVCFALITCLSALLFSYVGIMRTVLRSRRRVENANQLDLQRKKKLRNERQLIVAIIIMVTSFIILFLPSGTILLLTLPTSWVLKPMSFSLTSCGRKTFWTRWFTVHWILKSEMGSEIVCFVQMSVGQKPSETSALCEYETDNSKEKAKRTYLENVTVCAWTQELRIEGSILFYCTIAIENIRTDKNYSNLDINNWYSILYLYMYTVYLIGIFLVQVIYK